MRKPTTSFAPGTDGDQLLTTIIDQQICLMLHDGEKGKLDLAVGLSQSGGSDMCDYSLHNVRSRPAKVGNKLTTRDFGTVHGGFAAFGTRKPGGLCSAGDGVVASQLRSVRPMHRSRNAMSRGRTRRGEQWNKSTRKGRSSCRQAQQAAVSTRSRLFRSMC